MTLDYARWYSLGSGDDAPLHTHFGPPVLPPGGFFQITFFMGTTLLPIDGAAT